MAEGVARGALEEGRVAELAEEEGSEVAVGDEDGALPGAERAADPVEERARPARAGGQGLAVLGLEVLFIGVFVIGVSAMF